MLQRHTFLPKVQYWKLSYSDRSPPLLGISVLVLDSVAWLPWLLCSFSSGTWKWLPTGPVGQCDGVGDKARWGQAAWLLAKLIPSVFSGIWPAEYGVDLPVRSQGQEGQTGKEKSKCPDSRNRRAGSPSASDLQWLPWDSEQISLFLKLPEQVSLLAYQIA